MEAVIFIGIPSSGKSTFYAQRFAETHTRINLDTLKTRRREEAVFLRCLEEHRSFVVDNTNVLESERARYIPRARSAGYRVIGYFFDTAVADAIRRNAQRAGKSAVPPQAIYAKQRLLQPPRYPEGFHALFAVQIDAAGQCIVSPVPAVGAEE